MRLAPSPIPRGNRMAGDRREVTSLSFSTRGDPYRLLVRTLNHHSVRLSRYARESQDQLTEIVKAMEPALPGFVATMDPVPMAGGGMAGDRWRVTDGKFPNFPSLPAVIRIVSSLEL